MVFVFIIAAWVGGVALIYDIKGMAWKVIWYALKATPNEPLLWIAPFLALILSIVIYVIIIKKYKTHWGGAKFQTRLKGNKIVSKSTLISITKEKGEQLIFGGVPVPKKVESTQFLIGGSTGSGKSVCIAEYMDSATARGDRLICVDPDGGFMRYFFQEGDKILNPFDTRSEGWSIFNEIRSTYDCDQYAISLIPKSPSTEQETWNSMARTIVSEVLAVLLKTNKATTKDLLYWITVADNDALHSLLANTTAAGCFHGAEDTMASIRTVLTNYISPHKFLKEGNFSFRDWLENSEGNLYITWREDMLQALKPLISTWTDVFCASVLSLQEDKERRLHLIVDEMDSLEKLNYMVDAATKGRKKGLRIMPGIQSFSQLNDTYGKNDALTLRNSFRSFIGFSIGDLDTYTAEEFSNAFGKHTIVRKERSVSIGTSSSRGNLNKRIVEEVLITPTEIHLLPDLTGYLKFAGNHPICRITLKIKDRPIVTESMIIDEAKYAITKNPVFLEQ